MNHKFTTCKLNIAIPLFFCAFILCMPMLLFDNEPARDAVSRYAPMAEAFADSLWTDAFNPRIPPLFIIMTGIIRKFLNVSPETACQIISALFFALTVFPLTALFRLIYNGRYAAWAGGMYILCSRLMRIGGLGIRDTAKCFFLMLAAYGLICFLQKLDWKSAVYCSLGCIGLALTRGDSLLFALLFLAALGVGEIYKRKCFPVKTLGSGFLFLFLISPWLIYEYRHTGWPVTELRQAIVLNRLLKREQPYVTPVGAAAKPRLKSAVSPVKAGKKGSFAKNLMKGFYPQYLIFILPVIIFRIYRRKMSGEELILLLMVFVHTLGMIGQIAIADKKLFIYKRYLIVATPLMFGWGAVGARWFYDKLRRVMGSRYRWVCTVIIFMVITGLIFDGWSRVRKKRLNPYLYEQVEIHTGIDLRK